MTLRRSGTMFADRARAGRRPDEGRGRRSEPAGHAAGREPSIAVLHSRPHGGDREE